MNTKHIAIILGAAMAMASCSSDEAVMPVAGESMLRIVTETPGRAMFDGTSFLPGDTIGIIISQTRQDNVSTNTGNENVINSDLYAVCMGAGWELSEPVDLSQYSGSVNITGYYPYTRVSRMGDAISRTLLPGDTDYMRAIGQASASSPVASLAFEHQMVRLDTTILLLLGATSDEIVDSIVVEDVRGWRIDFLVNKASNVVAPAYPDQVNVKAVVNKPLSSQPEASFALLKSDYVLYPVKVYTERATYRFQVPSDFSSILPGQKYSLYLYLEPIGQ